MEKDYEPFGGEWLKEMMKMNKVHIINMLKEALQKVTSNDEAYLNGYKEAIKDAHEERIKTWKSP